MQYLTQACLNKHGILGVCDVCQDLEIVMLPNCETGCDCLACELAKGEWVAVESDCTVPGCKGGH